ncbi:MAG: 4Fe-4S dicluster domain-containing protein [Anaerolineaceae bacterium]|nr:4Fe-4S dicluster domain-containing protein [Anaerolineaceae bacterium]
MVDHTNQKAFATEAVSGTDIENATLSNSYPTWTGLADLRNKCWSENSVIISLCRLRPALFPQTMEGGSLAKLKPELETKYKALRPDRSIASWAFRFAASLPGVMTILSGMTHEDQMQDNIATFTNFEPLNDEERKAIEDVTAIMLDIPLIGCTACRYCVDGCPMKISIPDVFRAVNTMTLYNESFRPRSFYGGLISTGHGRASDCIGCGQCESVCPQHLPIIELMKEAAKKLDA